VCGKATLNRQEQECYHMFVLWKKANTKPWEINRGEVYPEDINAFLKMMEFEANARKMKHEREEASARLQERLRDAQRSMRR
jgi:hypothetical protein